MLNDFFMDVYCFLFLLNFYGFQEEEFQKLSRPRVMRIFVYVLLFINIYIYINTYIYMVFYITFFGVCLYVF